jgi:hypothetical protein
MSRHQILITEIRTRLDELEFLLNPVAVRNPTVIDPPNFKLSDSILKMNETVFKITPEQSIELCKFIVNTTNKQINIKQFVETIDQSRCRCYCLVKEIERREKFLTEGENLYYDEFKNKYYSQCRMPCILNNNNNCNRHTDVPQIDISRMKILTNPSYILTVDSIIQNYCMSHLPNEVPVVLPTQPVPVKAPIETFKKPSPIKAPVAVPKKQTPVKAPVAVPKKQTPVEAPVAVSKKQTPVEAPVAVRKKQTPVEAPVAVHKLIENSDIESSSDSENESDSNSEVDMIVSKVSESLNAPEEESGSEQEDSDDCMLDADEIHDEEGNTYYIDEAKSVIKLDEEGYGIRLGMLKEFKSGNIFYKNKHWKIEYFPNN